MRTLRIAFIAVNYRTLSDAIRFASLFNAAPDSSRVVLIDNSDGDQEGLLCEQIGARGSKVTCLKAPGNLGYFGGIRFGLATPHIRDFAADWFVISNVDLSFDPQALMERLSAHHVDELAAIAPDIRSTQSGLALNPFMSARPTRARMIGYKWIFRWYWSMALYSRLSTMTSSLRGFIAGSPEASGAHEIYAPHGSLMILSREYFRRGGTLDHAPLIYGEEICIAEQSRILGLPVKFDPQIKVAHAEHSSTGRLASRTQHRLVSEAASHVAEKYFG